MMESVDELETQACAIIEARRLRLQRHLAVGGIIVDLVVEGQVASGEPALLALQLRSWPEPSWLQLAAYAARETEHLEESSFGLRAKILVPGRGAAPEPLVTLEGLQELLSTWSLAEALRLRGPAGATASARPVAFCAMPFHADFLDVYLLGIVPAVQEVGLDVNRTDQTHSFVAITRRIWEGISSAVVVIADISGHNPNVMYEIGLAHGLGSKTFLLGDSTSEIPFDVKDTMMLSYDRKKIHRLQQDLAVRLREALNSP